MATAAFKSSTKRSAIGAASVDLGSSNRGGSLLRSRSLSSCSGLFPPPPLESDAFPTERGLEFPEISLDDLADEFFLGKEEEEEVVRPAVSRSGRQSSDFSYRMETDSSRRRGRSVSRNREQGERKGFLENNGASKGVSAGRLRRQRSVSVARHRYSDSESHSSALTDDEVRDACVNRSATEKTIRAVYAQRKTEHPNGGGEETRLYEAMRKEVRHAVEEIRTELERVMVKAEPIAIVNGDDGLSNGSNVIQAIAEIRRNYTTKLEQSEKRRQNLLAELAAEEHRGQELTMIVRELLPAPKQTSVPERSSQFRRKSNDRTKMSRRLTEEAEKYFEGFLSNVEDADISSYDGERSDTSSTLGGSTKLRGSTVHSTIEGTHESLRKAASLPVETDGVVLPWLQWETGNDGSPSPCKTMKAVPVDSENSLFGEAQEATASFNDSNHFTISHGSSNPSEGDGSSSVASRDIKMSRFDRSRGPPFDMDDYLHFQCSEDLLFERFRQRQRIESGSLVLCGRTSI